MVRFETPFPPVALLSVASVTFLPTMLVGRQAPRRTAPTIVGVVEHVKSEYESTTTLLGTFGGVVSPAREYAILKSAAATISNHLRHNILERVTASRVEVVDKSSHTTKRRLCKMEEECASPIQLNLTGAFEADFVDTCKRFGIDQFPRVLKIGFPLPPLPMPKEIVAPASAEDVSTSNMSLANISASTSSVSESIGRVTVSSRKDASTTNLHAASYLVPGQKSIMSTSSDHMKSESIASLSSPNLPAADKIKAGHSANTKYYSRYKFQPTICVETAEGDEEEDIYKVQVRGWRMTAKISEALSNVLTACTTVTNLALWNCGLAEPHFLFILGTVLTSNIRHLNLDQNPKIPEGLYGHLLSDDSLLKHLSLRMNKITCIGAKAIAGTLKTNRTICSLDLWCNSIAREGSEMLAEALKFNQSLTSLSLAKNSIGDDGVAAFAKMLSNVPLLHDELAARKKALVDLDRIRREQEDDAILKKAKSKVGHSLGRTPTGKKSEENLSKGATDPKNGKKGGPAVPAASPAKAAAAGAAAKPGAPPGKPDKKTPEVVPPKKGGAPAAPAAAPAAPEKGGKGAKAATAAAPPAAAAAAAGVAAASKGKKGPGGKVEEKEEIEETADQTAGSVEPTFEHNGVTYLVGNRTLNNLNVRQNGLTEIGLKCLVEAVGEQDLSIESGVVESGVGLFRVSILENSIDKENVTLVHLQSLLNAKNPWIEPVVNDKDREDTGEQGNPEVE